MAAKIKTVETYSPFYQQFQATPSGRWTRTIWIFIRWTFYNDAHTLSIAGKFQNVHYSVFS